MFEVKAGDGTTIKLSAGYVARTADRLMRLPEAQRDVRLERAQARVAGKYPSRRDAAIVALANH